MLQASFFKDKFDNVDKSFVFVCFSYFGMCV